MLSFIGIFPRLVSACLRSLLICLQRKIKGQQKSIFRHQTPKILSDVLHNAIDRRLLTSRKERLTRCSAVQYYQSAINKKNIIILLCTSSTVVSIWCNDTDCYKLFPGVTLDLEGMCRQCSNTIEKHAIAELTRS